MAQLSFTLDKRRANALGQFPIKLQVTHNRTNTTIATGIFIAERFFTHKDDTPISATHPNAQELNNNLRSLYNDYLNALTELNLRGGLHNMTAADIRAFSQTRKERNSETTFTSMVSAYVAQCRSKKTQYCYTHALSQLQEYLHKDKITFEELNYATLKSFEKTLEVKGLGINARGVTLRSIRSIFNEAIRQELVSPNLYPFRRYTLQSATPEKKSVGVGVLVGLRDLDLSGTAADARDFFLASFYLCGMNPVDLFSLPLCKGEVVYVRQKVRFREPQPTHIAIQEELQSIIDRHKGKEHLLDFAERYSNYDTFKRNISDDLKRVGKMLGVDLCFKMTRQTWASIADHLDISHDVISKALGHCDKGVTEVHYINFDWTRVDKANRAVLDYVNNFTNCEKMLS